MANCSYTCISFAKREMINQINENIVQINKLGYTKPIDLFRTTWIILYFNRHEH